MQYLAAHGTADRPRVSGVLVGRHALRLVSNGRNRLFEKSFSRRQIAGGAKRCIDQIAVSVERTIQVMPLPMNFDIRLIDVPRFACLPASL